LFSRDLRTKTGTHFLSSRSRKLRFSIIIANYNYARFVHRAIESALALDWPNVEVIVIDDGSTDSSVGVIGGFESRIVFRSQANAGQRVANNLGFTLASGDVVVFLDADDVLKPAFAREVAAVWQPGISNPRRRAGAPAGPGLSGDFASTRSRANPQLGHGQHRISHSTRIR
jgi:glycosyltransferase involved in cell wall biosynthesis